MLFQTPHDPFHSLVRQDRAAGRIGNKLFGGPAVAVVVIMEFEKGSGGNLLPAAIRGATVLLKSLRGAKVMKCPGLERTEYTRET